MNLKHYSSAQGVLLKMLSSSLFVTAFFHPSTGTVLMLRTLKSVCQRLHFPSEVQFHISNCLLTLQKPQILLVQTEFTIFLSAPIPIPGSSIRFTYLMNDTTKSPDQTKTPGVTLLIPFSSIIQSTPSICISNHLSYGGAGTGWAF